MIDEKHHKFDEMEKDGTDWFKTAISLANVEHVGALTYQFFTGKISITKEVLAKYLTDSIKLVNRQNLLIEGGLSRLITPSRSIIGESVCRH